MAELFDFGANQFDTPLNSMRSAGKAVAVIIDTEMKVTKAGTALSSDNVQIISPFKTAYWSGSI